MRTQDFLTMLRYFNTVGSKEGWTPKTFVSSRANRNKDQPAAQAQRAEDFMDEEDLAAAAESRQLETTQAFAGIGGGSEQSEDGLFGLFMTREETMGMKIAQKMGWRRDQGIGRKIRRAARSDDDAEPATSSTHMYAPKDAHMMMVSKGDNQRKGLGYTSEARLGVTQDDKTDESTSFGISYLETTKPSSVVKRPSVKKSSFGVGVLNDTGSDDEDPYELGPKITLNKTIGKEKKAKKPSKFAKPGGADKIVFVPKKASSKALVSLSKPLVDAKPSLRGFTLASSFADLSIKRKYPPPQIPPGWTCSRKTSSSAESQPYQSVADAAKASALDAKGRSALLGEKQLPGKSIFDFIPKDARDRLATLSGKADLPQGLGQSGPEGHLPAAHAQPKDLWSLIPTLEKSLAAGALAKGATGWMPYAEDLSKRKRYTSFLELRAGLKNELPIREDGVSISDWVKELQEFAHAAQVFKPATGIMASRFTSSTSSPGSGAATPTDDTTLLRQPPSKPEDPAEQAAKLGMYGAMTRSSFPFYPSRLLCKRFNVKPPADLPPGFDTAEGGMKSQTEEAVSKSAMDKMIHEVLTNGPAIQRPAWMGAAVPPSADAGSVSAHEQGRAEGGGQAAISKTGHAVVNVETNEALENGRAPEDVFKSIFGDDDDDDDDEEFL